MTTFTPREYPTVEIVVCAHSEVPERRQEGDILAVRRPDIGIGLAEAKLYLWLLVQGLAANEYDHLDDSIYEPFDPTGEYDPRSAYPLFDKRRYCIPFTRLQAVFPTLDLSKARDTNDPYQPFYTIDEDNNLWLTDRTPLAAEGLVFDKVNGVYI